MSPPTNLSFTVGIYHNTQHGDFSYSYYRNLDWYVNTFYICSKYFPKYKIEELKKVISDIKTSMIGRNITRENYHYNSNLYFADNFDAWIINEGIICNNSIGIINN